jgi:hypothetical protein
MFNVDLQHNSGDNMNMTQNNMAMKGKFSFPSPGADPAWPNSNTEFNQKPFSSLAVKHTN